MFQNLKAKIGHYRSVLGFTSAQQLRMKMICGIFISINESVEQVRATSNDLGAWQQTVFVSE